MIRTLLRRPRGAELAADAVRVLAFVSVFVAAAGWGPLKAVSIGSAALATLLPRLIGVRPAFDILFGVVTMVAAWSGVLGIYQSMRWWDIPVHFALNGVIAALAYVLLVRLDVIADAARLSHPRLTTIVVTTALGLSFGVLWEMLEWFVKTYIDGGTLVGYEDSLGDMLAGGAGSLAAGFAMRFFMADSRAVPRESRDGRDD